MAILEELQNINEYNEKKEGGKFVVIDIYADWCGPCKSVLPVLERLNEENSSIEFFKLDADNDEFSSVLQEFGIRSIPSFVFIKNGDVVEVISGTQSNISTYDYMNQKIDLHFS